MFRFVSRSFLAAACCVAAPATVLAQDGGSEDVLSRLVTEAVERNPRLEAERSAVMAEEARISQAAAWDDPVLTLGFMNLRTTSFDFSDDFMTMKVLQLAQRIPLPGQLGHHRDAARKRAEAAEHGSGAARIEVVSAVKRAYADLYYLDRALETVQRNLALLDGLMEVSRSRYATGVGGQPALLRVGLEIDGMETRRIRLMARRHAALARLNSLRDRPTLTPLPDAPFPSSLQDLVEQPPGRFAFASALGIGDAEPALASPAGLPRLEALEELALREHPRYRAHVARIEAQEELVGHARAMRWPAPRLSIGYGQRDGFPDMLNATVSFQLPLFQGAKQSAAVREETAVLARERATHRRMVADIESDVAAAYAVVLDALAQLELYDLGVLARSRAALDATLAAYRSGSEDFLALLDSQAVLYGFELERHRRTADLLIAWATLESAVGQEIEP